MSLDKEHVRRQARARRRERSADPSGSSSGIEVDWDSFEALFARGGPRAAPADGSVAHERAALRRRRAGRLRDERLLVAAAQAVHRARARGVPLAPDPGRRVEIEVTVEHRRKRAAARGGASCRSSIRSGSGPDAVSRRPTTRSSSAAATTVSSTRPTCARGPARCSCSSAAQLVGGAAVTEEVFPGFKFSVFSYVVSLLRPEIIRDLDLPRHGLQILPLESTVTPLPNGDYLAQLGRSRPNAPRARPPLAARRRGLRRVRAPDAPHGDGGEADPRHGPARSDVARAAAISAGCCKLGKHFRASRAGAVPRARTSCMTMSAADFLDEWFESDAAQGAPSRRAGSSARSWARARPARRTCCSITTWARSTARFAPGASRRAAPARSARRSRARRAPPAPRSGPQAPVAQVLVENGRATGVVLENGDEITAGVVVSGARSRAARSSSSSGEKQLPDDFVDADPPLQASAARRQGEPRARRAAGLHLPARAAGPHLRGAISISPSIDYLERAYDDAKYGDFSRRPYMDIIIPSMIDPGMAPPGKHVMSIFVQYAPYHLNGGWTDASARRSATRSSTRSPSTRRT